MLNLITLYSRLTHIKLIWTVKNLTFVKIEFCIIFICSLRILPQQLWLLAKECNSMLILSEFLPTIGANPPKVIRNEQMKIIQNSILTNVKFFTVQVNFMWVRRGTQCVFICSLRQVSLRKTQQLRLSAIHNFQDSIWKNLGKSGGKSFFLW